MKLVKPFFLIFCLAAVAAVNAQAPQSINSQAVLRDAAGRLIANQPVGVRITIAQGSPTGTAAYVETHAVTTNDNGLYTITIGAGTPATGTFAAIDWGNGPYFITTDIDPAGGTSYTITTSQQFLSVPYALFADTAARVAQASTANNANHATNADASTTSLHADRADYADTALYYRERQVLTLGHDTIYLTGGSYVVLPPSGNANINNHYIDSVIRANNSTVVNHYVDSVVQANNTTVVNNIQNQISDSVRQMQTTINNTITTQMRDSIIAIIRDSANTIQQSISTLPSGTCYASCGSVDSLRRRQDSVRRAFDSVVGVQDITLHRYDSIINVQRRDIHRYDSIIRIYDSVIGNYDSVVNILVHRVDSVSNTGTTDPSDPCYGRTTTGVDTRMATDFYTWINGRTYTASNSTAQYNLRHANAEGCDSIVTLNLTITYSGAVVEDGALPGVFSVSATQKVRFSQGNLQYQYSTNTWRFAENQYDAFTTRRDSIWNSITEIRDSNIYMGHLWQNLFSWGTSGYEDPNDYYNTLYHPLCGYSEETVGGFGPSSNMSSPDLTNESRNSDWGVYNPIVNGGNVAGAWRTPTIEEWYYLLFERTASYGRFCKAKVNGVGGVILFPDSYSHPTGIPIPQNIDNATARYTDAFTATAFRRMEQAGAVFLPANFVRGVHQAGNNTWSVFYHYINGDSRQSLATNYRTSYWSSTHANSNYAFVFSFNEGTLWDTPPYSDNINGTRQYRESRTYRCCVRLVQDYNE